MPKSCLLCADWNVPGDQDAARSAAFRCTLSNSVCVIQLEPVPADAPELSKEDARLLEQLPDAPRTVIPPEAVKKKAPAATRRAASQEEPIAA